MRLNSITIICIMCVVAINCKANKEKTATRGCSFDQSRVVYPRIGSIRFDSVCEQKLELSNIENINTVAVYFGNYTYLIKSAYLIDSVSNDEKNMFYPTVLHQSLLIYFDAKFIDSVQFPFEMINQTLSKGGEVTMSESSLTTFGIAQTPNDTIIVIDGYGGCNSCAEFKGLYTLDGKPISIYYASKTDVFIDFEDRTLAKQKGIPSNGIDPKYAKVELW